MVASGAAIVLWTSATVGYGGPAAVALLTALTTPADPPSFALLREASLALAGALSLTCALAHAAASRHSPRALAAFGGAVLASACLQAATAVALAAEAEDGAGPGALAALAAGAARLVLTSPDGLARRVAGWGGAALAWALQVAATVAAVLVAVEWDHAAREERLLAESLEAALVPPPRDGDEPEPPDPSTGRPASAFHPRPAVLDHTWADVAATSGLVLAAGYGFFLLAIAVHLRGGGSPYGGGGALVLGGGPSDPVGMGLHPHWHHPGGHHGHHRAGGDSPPRPPPCGDRAPGAGLTPAGAPVPCAGRHWAPALVALGGTPLAVLGSAAALGAWTGRPLLVHAFAGGAAVSAVTALFAARAVVVHAPALAAVASWDASGGFAQLVAAVTSSPGVAAAVATTVVLAQAAAAALAALYGTNIPWDVGGAAVADAGRVAAAAAAAAASAAAKDVAATTHRVASAGRRAAEAAAAAWAESAPSRSLSSEGLLASDAEAGVASRSSGSGGGSGDDGEAEEPVGPPAFPAFAGTPWANKPRVA